MSKMVYQYDASGYFAGMLADYGLLPNNATYSPCMVESGFIPHWNGAQWEQVEDHKGESGYVDGQPYAIKEYGPYPEGWSGTPPPPTPEEQQEAMKKAFTDAIQMHLDGFAQTRLYDGVDSMSKYVKCSVPKFAIEAEYMRDKVAETWAMAYAILDAVLSGQRPMPTIEEVISELPALEWPEVQP